MTCLRLLFISSFAATDLTVTLLLHVHLRDFAVLRNDLQSYSFTASTVDFLGTFLIRFLLCAVAVVILCTARTKQRYKSIRKWSHHTVLTLAMSLTVYSPLKLLALAETVSDFSTVPWFWLEFAWNMLASIALYPCIWLRVHYVDRTGRSNLVTAVHENGSLANSTAVDVDDRAALVEDEEEEEDKPDPEAPDVPTGAAVLRLLRLGLLEWRLYAVGFVALIGYAVTRVFIPYYMGDVINHVVITRSYSELRRSILITVILSLAATAFAGLRGGAFSYGDDRVMILRVRSRLFGALVKQEIAFFDENKTGDITSRLTADTQTLSEAIGLNLNVALRNTVMFIGGLVFMFELSWQLTTVNFIALPLITFIGEVYGKFYEQLQQQVQDALAKANGMADEILGSMRTVRSFANEEREAKRYDDALRTTLAVNKKQTYAYMGFVWSNEVFELMLLVAILWYGGYLVIENRMPAPALVQFLLYQIQIGENLQAIGYVYTGLMQGVGASRKVFQYIDRQPLIPNDGQLSPAQVQGRLEFRDVHFTYPSRPDTQVLHGINFAVEPGEVVALVGPSGGGKSSCIALLEHFYEPSSGEIALDSISVKDYAHDYLHTAMSLVSQEPVLYGASIGENIAYGLERESVTQSDIEHAARLANAHDFIAALPKGYDSQTGEKGVQVSGGQKQRIAIARALIRSPRVLLLDEATSALDAESEHLVQQALHRNLSGRTVLLIAHRLSTVEKADRIVVIDKGRVMQQGNHSELLAQDGIYRNLVHRQLLLDGEGTQQQPSPPMKVASPETIRRSVSSRRSRSSSFYSTSPTKNSVDT